MPYHLPSHLHRSRCGVLYFRIAIPKDLRHHFGQVEIYRSLHTAKVSEAVLPAQTLALSIKTAFRRLRDEPMCATKTKLSYADDDNSFGLITEISFDEFRRPTSAKLTSEPNAPPGAMESAIRAALASTPAARSTMMAPEHSTIELTQLLSSYVDTYLTNAFAASKPNDKTLESYRAAVLLFIEIVGDKPLQRLNVSDQNRSEDVISKIPADRTKIAVARALSVDEMVALDVTGCPSCAALRPAGAGPCGL